MLLEAMFVGGAAVLTSLMGVPVAVRLARAELPDFSGRSEPAQPRAFRDAVVTSGFTPLDLGPDTTQWPSQRQWPASRIAAAEWPSKSWNDEHFGRQWRDGTATDVVDAGFHAMAHRQASSATAGATPSAPATPAARPRPAPAPVEAAFFGDAQPPPAARSSRADEVRRQEQIRAAQQRQRQEAAARQQEAIRQQAARQAAQQAQRPAAAPRPQRPAPVGGGSGPPTRAEIEQLVAAEGLAGTVQHIMRRTGWDFRKAAQYLARTRAS